MHKFEMGYALSSKGSMLEAVCVCLTVLQRSSGTSSHIANPAMVT